MRYSNLITLTAATLFTAGAHGATVSAFASQVLDYSNSNACEAAASPNTTDCDFVQPDFAGAAPAVDQAGLTDLFFNNMMPSANFGAVGSARNNAWIQLGFGSQQAVTGEGNDLVIFTIGNGYKIRLTAIDNSTGSEQILSDFIYDIPTGDVAQAVDENGDFLFLKNDAGQNIANISALTIDLAGIADGTEISYIRVFIGTDFNGTVNGNPAKPLFSLAGALHTTAAVPLPLPALLFSSGLALLGWTARRKRV